MSARLKMMDRAPFCSAHRYTCASSLPLLHFISPLYPFYAIFLLLSVSAPFPSGSCHFPLAFVSGQTPRWINNVRMKGASVPSSPPSIPFPSTLRGPRGVAVMFNQSDRDRTFHRDKVNRTMRGLTKLLTPRQLNMNKRCARFRFRALYNSEHF